MNKKLSLLLIPLKFAILFLISRYTYQLLSGEDVFYEQRGINSFCQNPPLPIDQTLCTSGKFKKFLLLYIDSVPFDLFSYKNPHLNRKSRSMIMKHYGITDSGPAFSSFATGKIANKYEGSIAQLDNVFIQFKQAGYKVKGYGYHYPIEEMLDKGFFDSYRNIYRGIHEALCPGFFDLSQITINKYEFVFQSLIEDPAKYLDKLKNYYSVFNKALNKRKDEIFECLDEKFTGDLSYFIYDVYTDVMGHQLSRQSEFYVKKMAAMKANLDLLSEYFDFKQPDTLLMFISDHGVVSSLWETEVNNHGVPENNNESFLHLFSSRFNNERYYEVETSHSYDFAAILAQYIANINIPLLSIGKAALSNTNKEMVFKGLRAKHAQIWEYIKSFTPQSLKEVSIELHSSSVVYKDEKLLRDSEAFIKLSDMMASGELEQTVAADEALNIYTKEVENWKSIYDVLLDTRAKNKSLKNFLISSLTCLLFIVFNIYMLIKDMSAFKRRIAITFLCLLLLLPVIFLVFNRVIQSLFVPYALISLGGLVITFTLKKKKIFQDFTYKLNQIIVLDLVLIAYNFGVQFNNAFFLYYQNQFLQLLLVGLLIVWEYVYYKQLKSHDKVLSQNLKRVFFGISFIVDAVMVNYEIILMSSFDYKQTRLMMYLSRAFYVGFILTALLCFNFYRNWREALFFTSTKLLFWLGSNFHRLAFYIAILNVFYSYSKGSAESKSRSKRLHNIFDFFVLIYQSAVVFILLRGQLDTDISVRSGQKNWMMTLEELPPFTGAIFAINKFLPFIMVFIYLIGNFEPRFYGKQRSFWNVMDSTMNSNLVRLTDIWYASINIVYLSCVDDPFTQRASFIFQSSALILIITAYASSFLEGILVYCTYGEEYVTKFSEVPQNSEVEIQEVSKRNLKLNREPSKTD